MTFNCEEDLLGAMLKEMALRREFCKYMASRYSCGTDVFGMQWNYGADYEKASQFMAVARDLHEMIINLPTVFAIPQGCEAYFRRFCAKYESKHGNQTGATTKE